MAEDAEIAANHERDRASGCPYDPNVAVRIGMCTAAGGTGAASVRLALRALTASPPGKSPCYSDHWKAAIRHTHACPLPRAHTSQPAPSHTATKDISSRSTLGKSRRSSPRLMTKRGRGSLRFRYVPAPTTTASQFRHRTSAVSCELATGRAFQRIGGAQSPRFMKPSVPVLGWDRSHSCAENAAWSVTGRRRREAPSGCISHAFTVSSR